MSRTAGPGIRRRKRGCPLRPVPGKELAVFTPSWFSTEPLGKPAPNPDALVDVAFNHDGMVADIVPRARHYWRTLPSRRP